MAGSYEDPTNAFGVIPSYLFNSTDASTHIYEYLAAYDVPDSQSFGHTSSDAYAVSDWSASCSRPAEVFLSPPLFVGCVLYPNVTRNVIQGSLPKNLTTLGFNSTEVGLNLRSAITTCLSGFCASSSGNCASTDACDVGNLLTSGYELSAQGVAQCWVTLCTDNVGGLDGDVAGIGMVASYIMQSCVALLGFLSLTILTFLLHRKRHAFLRRSSSLNSEGTMAMMEPHRSRWLNLEHHCAVITSVLAEFHKTQCYFGIALQIASLVTIVNEIDTTSWLNQHFLLFVSADGLIPVILTLYTLMSFGQKSWYLITLSVITVVMSATTGGMLTGRFLHWEALYGDNANSAEGSGSSAACGDIGAFAICQNLGPNGFGFQYVAETYLSVLTALVSVTTLLVLWKIFTESTTVWNIASSWLARTITTGIDYHAIEDGSERYRDSLRRVRFVIRVAFHSLVTLLLLACFGVELYEFNQALPIVDSDWSFGQLVGLTTWAGVFVDLAYMEYYGLSEGYSWRFPPWLSLTEDGGRELEASPGEVPGFPSEHTDQKTLDFGIHTSGRS